MIDNATLRVMGHESPEIDLFVDKQLQCRVPIEHRANVNGQSWALENGHPPLSLAGTPEYLPYIRQMIF